MKRKIFIVIVALSGNILFAQSTSTKALQEAIKLLGLEQTLSSINKEVIDNQIGKTNLKFKFELLRVKNNEEIIFQKYEYPLPEVDYNYWPNFENSKMNFIMYGDIFRIPNTALNLDKNFVEELKREQCESIYYTGLLVVPVKKVGDLYTLKLFLISYVQINGVSELSHGRAKEVSLKVGEKIRLELEEEKSSWSIKPKVNGKVVTLTSDNNFFKNVDEYLILSLEKD